MLIREQLLYNRTASHLAYIPVVNIVMGTTRIVIHICSLIKNLMLLLASTLSSSNLPGSLKAGQHIILMNVLLDLRGVLRGLLEIIPVLGSLGCLLYNYCLATPAQRLAYKVQNIYANRIPVFSKSPNPLLHSLTPQLIEDLVKLKGFEEFSNTRDVVDLRSLIIAGTFKDLGTQVTEPSRESSSKQMVEQLHRLEHADETTVNQLVLANREELGKLPKKKVEEIHKFLNGQQVFFSTDKQNLIKFLELGKEGQFEDPIFRDKNLIYIAFTAFALGLIDAGDLATTTELYITMQTFPDCRVHRLLDDKSALTPKGEQFVQAVGKPQEGLGGCPPNFRHDFVAAVQKLKPYQQVFWTHEPLVTSEEIAKMQHQSPLALFEMLYAPIGSLTATLAMLGVVYNIEGQQVGVGVHVHRAWMNQQYGTTATPHAPKLGTFTPHDIIAGIKQKHRLGATFGQGTLVTNVHQSLEPPSTIIQHDRVHGHILHQYGDVFINVILQMLGAIEKATTFTMSKEIWMIGEAVALSMQTSNTKNLRNFILDASGRTDETSIRELFWNPFEQKPFPNLPDLDATILLTLSKPVPTATLWIIFLDVYHNPAKYKGHETDLKSSEEWLLMNYAFEKGLISKTDDPKIQVWALQQLRAGNPIETIRNKKTTLQQVQLTFAKIGKAAKADPRRLNTIVLKVKDAKPAGNSSPAIPLTG